MDAFLRVVWEAATQRFRDTATGWFVSNVVAAATLRAMPSRVGGADVVIRDALGHFVPQRFFGGNVESHFITGAGQYAGVRRGIVDPEVDWLYRSHDVLQARVTVQTSTGVEKTAWVVMPKGIPFDADIFEDRLTGRMAEAIGQGSGRYETVPAYGISDIHWAVTSYYGAGQAMGEDIGRFGGLSG